MGGRSCLSLPARGASRLWLRPLDKLTAQPLAGTEGAKLSHSGRPTAGRLASSTESKLKRIDLGGGSAQTLANAVGRGGTWSADGVILFARRSKSAVPHHGLGRRAVAVTKLPTNRSATGFLSSCPAAGNSCSTRRERRKPQGFTWVRSTLRKPNVSRQPTPPASTLQRGGCCSSVGERWLPSAWTWTGRTDRGSGDRGRSGGLRRQTAAVRFRFGRRSGGLPGGRDQPASTDMVRPHGQGVGDHWLARREYSCDSPSFARWAPGGGAAHGPGQYGHLDSGWNTHEPLHLG